MIGTRWVKLAGVGALSVALFLPAQAEGQRDDDRERDLELHLRDVEGRVGDLLRLSGSLRIGRAQLGVSIEDDDAGARIASVRDDGPADRAGLAEGDVIVALNGAELSRAVEEEDDEDEEWGPTRRLIHLMADIDPGDAVRIDYVRDGRRASVDVTAAERSAWEGLYRGANPLVTYARGMNPGRAMVFGFGGFQGANLADVNEGLGSYFGVQSGALVLDVDDEENDLGLRPGDVIVEIGGRDVEDSGDAYRILGSYETGERLRVVVVRERSRVTLEGTAD